MARDNDIRLCLTCPLPAAAPAEEPDGGQKAAAA